MNATITIEVFSQKITIPVALPENWASMTPAEQSSWLNAEEEQLHSHINVYAEVTN